MDKKTIGITIIIIGIVLLSTLIVFKEREDVYIKEYMKNNGGSCFLDDGTCLHADRTFFSYLISGIFSGSLIVLGVYLYFFDQSEKVMALQNEKITKTLMQAKKIEKDKDEFKAFLSTFDEDEQTILKAIKDQDGIKQSTLRYRTGISKTRLSLILKNLNERKIISKKPAGKTNQIFLVKKF